VAGATGDSGVTDAFSPAGETNEVVDAIIEEALRHFPVSHGLGWRLGHWRCRPEPCQPVVAGSELCLLGGCCAIGIEKPGLKGCGTMPVENSTVGSASRRV